jgi:single-strand DNA-binding protein
MLGNEQITIIGHIGQDATIKEFNGNRFLSVSVAVNDGYKDQQGNWVDKTNWWSVSLRNERLAPHLTKGKYVLIQGTPRIKVYKGNDGQYYPAMNISADSVLFLKQAKQEGSSQPAAIQQDDVTDLTDQQDDLPF